MSLIANRRSVMTLFSSVDCPQCHRVRIVLAEKDISVDIVNIDPEDKPEDLLELNPYNTVPTLIDRDLVIYEPRIMKEYLDERFPHPPLMPVDPVSRARTRLALYRVERDWYSLVNEIEAHSDKEAEAKKILQELVIASADIFSAKPYFLSEDFSLADATIAPILWRLEHYGIETPASTQSLQEYMKRIFDRSSFIESLTEAELELRS